MKAIALISGGLDSTLATKLMKDLDLELICLNTTTPFCLCNHRSSSGCLHSAAQVAKELGLKLISLNVAKEFIQVLKNPKHGYGSNMNPCIDCRILLFKKAKELMEKEGAVFLITGEVLGQRPMSQRKETMRIIEEEAGLLGLVVRPLSAKVLTETIPEKQGWLNREKLLNISGRGRKEQIALAAKLSINDYPCPSGGCLLTDPEFSRRLKDLMRYQELNLDDIHLLKLGRHFRLNTKAKLIVGRNEKENLALQNFAKDDDYIFRPLELPGPTALGRGNFSDEMLGLCCAIISRYCDLNGSLVSRIGYRKFPIEEMKILNSPALEEKQLESLRV